MASFKRADLREILGEAYTDDLATRLVDLHRSVVDPLKDDLDAAKRDATRYKADAEKLPGVQKELADLKSGEDWKGKYEKEKADHDAYKQQVARDAEAAKIKAAYRKLLIEERISTKTIDAVLDVTDYSKMKLKEDGTLDGADGLRKEIGEKWGGFQVSTRQRGENVDTPPKTGNGKMTREEIMAIKDTAARQRAIQENPEAFQKG